ncbi:uncharacterized protein [Onthophagus taurus]|uniref:uncharacterized protein n=1 Tax=Onthophagus taurus TaxID=166361 RepID=UPI0039BE9EBD
MPRLIVLVVLLLASQLGEAKKRKRSGEVYSYQSVDNGGVVDILKNTRGAHTFQSVDANGNVQSSSINYMGSNTGSDMGYNSGNVKIIKTNGNNLVLDLSTNSFNNNNMLADDYYYDNDSQISIISHYAQLMNNFITPISVRYNTGFIGTTDTTNVLEYIFVHYYSGKLISSDVINFRPEDLHTCPLIEYCLKETRPLCIGTITYCVTPIRKTAGCSPEFKNGNKPCLTTTIPNKNKKEEKIVLPCIAILAQTGSRKKYCATTIVVNTKMRETMAKVERTVQSSMARAQQAIANGLNAGRLGLQRGMETMRKAFGRYPMFNIN